MTSRLTRNVAALRAAKTLSQELHDEELIGVLGMVLTRDPDCDDVSLVVGPAGKDELSVAYQAYWLLHVYIDNLGVAHDADAAEVRAHNTDQGVPTQLDRKPVMTTRTLVCRSCGRTEMVDDDAVNTGCANCGLPWPYKWNPAVILDGDSKRAVMKRLQDAVHRLLLVDRLLLDERWERRLRSEIADELHAVAVMLLNENEP